MSYYVYRETVKVHETGTIKEMTRPISSKAAAEEWKEFYETLEEGHVVVSPSVNDRYEFFVVYRED